MNELNNCFLRIFLKLIISSEVKAIKGFLANNNNSCKYGSVKPPEVKTLFSFLKINQLIIFEHFQRS